jgi:hypothetical protein
MNKIRVIENQVKKISKKIIKKNNKDKKYSALSKEDALTMTSEVIEKYRPALEKLAE